MCHFVRVFQTASTRSDKLEHFQQHVNWPGLEHPQAQLCLRHCPAEQVFSRAEQIQQQARSSSFATTRETCAKCQRFVVGGGLRFGLHSRPRRLYSASGNQTRRNLLAELAPFDTNKAKSAPQPPPPPTDGRGGKSATARLGVLRACEICFVVGGAANEPAT